MVPEYRYLDNPRDERLAQEHQLLDDFCAQSDLISYDYEKRRGGLPPVRYYFHYNLRSIIGINEDQSPLYGMEHTAEVVIPAEYPLGGQPECNMTTPAWHPNVNFHSRYKGRICINADALGDWHTLDMLAERIGEMLQYKNYHAVNEIPYPEDAKVALWVREYAEKNNIFNKAKRHYVDSRPLLRLSPEWEERRASRIKKATGITINGRRTSGLSAGEQQKLIEDIPVPNATPNRPRRSIKITPKQR